MSFDANSLNNIVIISVSEFQKARYLRANKLSLEGLVGKQLFCPWHPVFPSSSQYWLTDQLSQAKRLDPPITNLVSPCQP